MFQFLLCALLTLFVTGCDSPRYIDYFPYDDQGIAKSKVALIPMMDRSGKDLPCDASEQFTRGIRYEMMDHAKLYLLPQEQVSQRVASLGKFDFFIKDQTLSDLFCDVDFIILMELVEHDLASGAKDECTKQEYCCYDRVLMKIRVRVLDVRRRCPVIVLQEVIPCNYQIPCAKQDMRVGTPCVDHPEYRLSPAGQAHQRMINSVVERLECVIQGAR